MVVVPQRGYGLRDRRGQSLVANAPNPNNAKTWIDWALQADTQEIGPTVGSFQLPTNPDAAVSDLSVDLDEVDTGRLRLRRSRRSSHAS